VTPVLAACHLLLVNGDLPHELLTQTAYFATHFLQLVGELLLLLCELRDQPVLAEDVCEEDFDLIVLLDAFSSTLLLRLSLVKLLRCDGELQTLCLLLGHLLAGTKFRNLSEELVALKLQLLELMLHLNHQGSDLHLCAL